MDRIAYSPQSVIFREGEYQKWLFSICGGAVDIISGYGTSGEKKLVTLTQGQFFGEIGMIAMLPRTATAVAAESGAVLEQVTYEELEDYLKNHPENIQLIMRSVSHRIRELTDDLSLVNRTVTEMLNKRTGPSFGTRLSESMKKLLSALKEKRGLEAHFAAAPEDKLATAGEHPAVVRCRSGEVIFRAGDDARCMCEIYSGTVGIYADYNTGSQKLLARLTAGEVFGEMGILDDMPRSATAVCLEQGSILMVGRENFLEYFRTKPMKVLQILQQMCMQLRSLSGEYLRVCKTLEELTARDAERLDEDYAVSQLEQMTPVRLMEEIYDGSFRADWVYFR